uniref:Uncharacterized protein n=1 Tax=Anguilla anguilla TaxID=7936 RepID=A0A0E9TST8_ANGAN
MCSNLLCEIAWIYHIPFQGNFCRTT